MATLVSPGVDVSVIDESFNVGAGPGTVPFIVIATQQDKLDPSGTAVAEGTKKQNAGKLNLISSQRELLQNFGEPVFYSTGGTARHGYPLNEYGLLAAHSYLGLSNRAYIIRADVDLAQLEPSDVAPVGTPAPGTYWMDLDETNIGVFVYDLATTSFVQQPVSYITNEALLDSNGVPVPSAPGAIGSYSVVAGVVAGAGAGREENQLFRRGPTAWELVDASSISENVIYRPHTQVPQTGEVLDMALTSGGSGYAVNDTIDLIDTGSGTSLQIRVTAENSGAVTDFVILNRGTNYDGSALTQTATSGGGSAFTATANVLSDGDIWIKTTSPNAGTDFSIKYYDVSASSFVEVNAPLARSRDAALLAYADNPQVGDLFVHYDMNNETTDPLNFGASSRGEFSVMRHNGQGTTVATGTVEQPTVADGNELSINGVTVTFTNTLNAGQPLPLLDTATDTGILGVLNSAAIPNVIASVGPNNQLVLTQGQGKDIQVIDLTGSPITELGLTSDISLTNGFVHSNWSYLVYEASATEPTTSTPDGTLWYSTTLQVDLLRNNGQGSWDELTTTVYLQPAQPTVGLTIDDLWVDTDQLADYPVISRYNGTTWVQLDNADQTSPNGVIFADARPTPTFGSDVGANNGGLAGFPDLDADAPDPLIYPQGMLLWNTRYSTYNVKRWDSAYMVDGVLVGGRWVNESGNREDGSPYMGNDAVKEVIVERMQAAVSSNEDVRAESIFFNLLAAPGYPEMIDELITLNTDRKLTGFVIGDSPFTLSPASTELQNWATNFNQAPTNGDDGLVTSDTYLGVYYPSGLTTNTDGEDVVVPASHIVLRTMAFNDQVAYPWFAPAGYQRGIVTNAVSVGWVTPEEEYQVVELNQGQRDILYTNNVNPIAFRPNQGLVVFGQKTRHPNDSALDRINVVRLVNYLRYQAPQLAEPYLYQPNDYITRNSVVNAYDRFLEGLVTLRALNDFAVVCDESNNTPARIDRNELWIDLLIQPIRGVEFIYIPIRIRNTGSDLTLAS